MWVKEFFTCSHFLLWPFDNQLTISTTVLMTRRADSVRNILSCQGTHCCQHWDGWKHAEACGDFVIGGSGDIFKAKTSAGCSFLCHSSSAKQNRKIFIKYMRISCIHTVGFDLYALLIPPLIPFIFIPNLQLFQLRVL